MAKSTSVEHPIPDPSLCSFSRLFKNAELGIHLHILARNYGKSLNENVKRIGRPVAPTSKRQAQNIHDISYSYNVHYFVIIKSKNLIKKVSEGVEFMPEVFNWLEVTLSCTEVTKLFNCFYFDVFSLKGAQA
jgi:hypothetical protein